MARHIEAISLSITTFCSRQCPTCCLRYDHEFDADVEYVKWVLDQLNGEVHRVHITGGEPVEAPYFVEITMHLMSVMKHMTIETAKYHEMLGAYDEIYWTRYDDNKEDTEKIIEMSGTHPFPKVHLGYNSCIPDKPGDGTICHRGKSNLVSIFAGRVYPCCVAPGVKGAVSIPLTRDWKKEIAEISPPCSACRFSGRD